MKTTITLAVLAPLVAFAKPMLDDSHDRVQTTLAVPMERVGTILPRAAKEVGRSHLAIGCEMLPRGYGDFEAFKEYLPPLGIVRVRLHAGWAKLEPEPGRWDFEWLDRQVAWLIAEGLEPFLETSYGNPAYPGAGGASLSDGLPQGEAALAAWDRYVEKLATRYPQVKHWACWNEPNNIKANTPAMVVDNNIRTARIIRKHIPDAKIAMLSLGWANLPWTKEAFACFKAEKALDLFDSIIYHDYSPNPDACYGACVDAWAAYVRAEAPHLQIFNGESGATSAPHYSAPISSQKWNSELTQAKWNARRLVADLGHGFDSLVFTIYDPCYDMPERYCYRTPAYWVRTRPDRFMKRMGLVKCNDRLEVVKVKSAYYTVQNVASLFDATIESAKIFCRPLQGQDAKGLVTYTFRQKGTNIPIIALWDASGHPTNENTLRTVSLDVRKAAMTDPVWIDLVTGAIYELPPRMAIGHDEGDWIFDAIPYYDAPVLITDRALVMP